MIKLDRCNWIDFLKGIGIILVIIGHLDWDNPICTWIYSFHLPLLWVLSGVTARYNEVELGKKKSIRKIIYKCIYPYITFSILALLYLVVAVSIFNRQSKGEIKLALLETCTFIGYQTLWYLPTLCFSEIVYVCVKKLKNASIVNYLVFFLAITGSVIIKKVTNIKLPLYAASLLIGRVLIAFTFYYIGTIFYDVLKTDRFAASPKRNCIFGLLLLFSVYLSLKNGHIDIRSGMINSTLIFWVCSIMTSCIIIAIFYKNPGMNLINYFGKNSLIIMCTQSPLPVISFTEKILSKAHMTNYISKILLGVVIVLVAESIIIRFINKYGNFMLSIDVRRKYGCW